MNVLVNFQSETRRPTPQFLDERKWTDWNRRTEKKRARLVRKLEVEFMRQAQIRLDEWTETREAKLARKLSRIVKAQRKFEKIQ